MYTYSQNARKNHQYNNPRLSLHLLTKEISKEAADKFQAADNEHINLEVIAILIKRILYGIIEAIITSLSETKNN